MDLLKEIFCMELSLGELQIFSGQHSYLRFSISDPYITDIPYSVIVSVSLESPDGVI